jgi:hypothetical protein
MGKRCAFKPCPNAVAVGGNDEKATLRVKYPPSFAQYGSFMPSLFQRVQHDHYIC